MSTKHCEQTDANHAAHFWGKGKHRCNGHALVQRDVAGAGNPLADPTVDTVPRTHGMQVVRLGDEDGETLLLISESLHRIAETLETLTEFIADHTVREARR